MDIILIGRIAEDGVLKLAEQYGERICGRYSRRYVSRGISELSADFADDAAMSIMNGFCADVYVIGRQGVFQALYRLGESRDCGLRVWPEKIPVKQFCIELSDLFDVSPYRISSLGCVLVCSDEGGRLVQELRSAGYEAAVIGYITDDKARCALTAAGLQYLVPDES